MCTYGMSKPPYSPGRNIANLGHFGTIFYTCMFGWNVCLFHFSNENSFKLLGITRKMVYGDWFLYLLYMFFKTYIWHTGFHYVPKKSSQTRRNPVFFTRQFITVNPYVSWNIIDLLVFLLDFYVIEVYLLILSFELILLMKEHLVCMSFEVVQ